MGADQVNLVGGKAKAVNSHVKYGVYSAGGDYAGMTVAQLRTEMGTVWQLPGDTVAYKGKEALADNYVITAGDEINFTRRMGEKG